MYPFTRKYQTGGKLDTNAMRDDVSKDGDFFRDGNYTQKGRRRLAAIQKVEDNQDRGLSYNIDDSTGSFEIVDALGRLDVNSGGHGIGSSERSGLLYGTFNKDKRSKREISSLMSGASKYIINDSKVVNNDDKDKADIIPDTTTDSTTDTTTINDDKNKVDPAPTGGDKVPLTKEEEEAKVLGIDLSKGATAKVLNAQKRLKAAGFDPGPLDGIWGVSTQEAWNKAYPTEAAGKTAEQIEAEARALIEAEAKAKAKAAAAAEAAANLESETVSSEGLDNIPDSPITKLDRIAEAGDIQEEINLRKSNGGVPSEDPRFKDRSVAELEMDKYDLVERGPVSTTTTTTTNTGGDLFDYDDKTNTSTQGGTLFSGIGEGDVKLFLNSDNTANQLFSSKYNKGIIDNREKIKLYRDEIKSRQDPDYNKANSSFSGESTDDLNKKIKDLNTEVSNSINDQVNKSYGSTVSYIKHELAKKEEELKNLIATNASSDAIKQSSITKNALRSRVNFLEKKIDKFMSSKKTTKDYKDFYGDVVLSDDNSVMWDTTRNKVVDSKTRSAEIKEVKKGKAILANVLKGNSWLKPEDRTKFRELISNENINKGDDGKGFDVQKMVDRATEEYIKDVGFFEARGTYKEDNGDVKSFINYVKEIGAKDIYKDLPHLKTVYNRYVSTRGSSTPKESYKNSTIPKIKPGEDAEEFLKNNKHVGVFSQASSNHYAKLGLGGTTNIDMIDGGYKTVTDFLKKNNITDKEYKYQPHKALWLYSKTFNNFSRHKWNELSKSWNTLHRKNMAKYEKGGVLKLQTGIKKLPDFLTTSLDGRTYYGTGDYEGVEGARADAVKYKADMAERARIKAIEDANNKAAYMKFNPGATDDDYNNLVGNVQTPGYVDPYNAVKDANIAANTRLVNGGKNTGYKPKFSFLPQLNLGDNSNSTKSTTPNFYTTRKTPEQIKQEEIDLHINNTQKLSPLSDNVERKELDPITNIVNKIFNKGADANQNLGPSQRPAQNITIPQKRQPAITKNPVGIEKQLPEIGKIVPYQYKGSGGADMTSSVKSPGAVMDIVEKEEGVVVPKEPKTLGEKILSSIKKTREFYTDSGNTGENNTEGNAPLFSRTGINTPLGEVQYNDLARYYLAKRARDRKVGDVKLNLKKHIDHGSRNVLAARDIDSAMLNEANREISKISGGYKGSDPLMNAVFNKIAGEARNKAKMGLISKRSDFRSKEQARVFDEMNKMRAERSADNVRANDVRFANNQLKFEAEVAKQQDKANRDTKFDNTRGKILSDLQGRANTNAALSKNLITESEVIDKQNRANLAEKKYKESYTAYQNAITNKLDPNIIAKRKKQMEADNDARNIDPYDRNKIIKDYDRINKGRSKLQLGNTIFKNLFGG